MNIVARWKPNGSFYPGKVSVVHPNGTCDIVFDDGDKRKNTPLEAIKTKSKNHNQQRAVNCAVGEYVQIRLQTDPVGARGAKKLIERSEVTFIDSALNNVQKELKTPGTGKVLVTLKITLHLRADFVRVENINAPERSTKKEVAAENNTLIKFLMEQQAATTPNNDPTLAVAVQCAQKFMEKERRRTEMVRQTTLTSQSTAVDKMLHAVQTSRQWEWDKGHRTAAPQPTGLNVSMRNYQLESLQFMLECETAELGVHEATYSKIITMKDKKTIYYSTTLGTFAHAINGSIKGGMLAEEMGLGKTIESLACILAHPRPSTEVCKEQMELVRADKTVNAAHRERIERGALEFGGTLVVCKVCKNKNSTVDTPLTIYPYKLTDDTAAIGANSFFFFSSFLLFFFSSSFLLFFFFLSSSLLCSRRHQRWWVNGVKNTRTN
jgi:hypothetical protein